jgi:gas vesicle protein
MDDNVMAKGLLIGLLAGAVIGVAVGMLYAPSSGSETREMIRERAMEAKDRAGEMVDKVKERAQAMRHNKETA